MRFVCGGLKLSRPQYLMGGQSEVLAGQGRILNDVD